MDSRMMELWRNAYRIIATRAPAKVKIPFADLIASHWWLRGPESSRHELMLFRMIHANVTLFQFQRQKDEEGFFLATLQDFKDVIKDLKELIAPVFLGISGDAFTLYKALADGTKLVGLTFEDIAKAVNETFGAEMPMSTIWEFYVYSLKNAGLLQENTDREDKRRRLYNVNAIDLSKLQLFDDEKLLCEAIGTGQDYDASNNVSENVSGAQDGPHEAELSSDSPPDTISDTILQASYSESDGNDENLDRSKSPVSEPVEKKGDSRR